MRPTITIRIGAAHDEVVVNGEAYDRSNLNRRQRDAMASLLLDALFPSKKPKARKRK